MSYLKITRRALLAVLLLLMAVGSAFAQSSKIGPNPIPYDEGLSLNPDVKLAFKAPFLTARQSSQFDVELGNAVDSLYVSWRRLKSWVNSPDALRLPDGRLKACVAMSHSADTAIVDFFLGFAGRAIDRCETEALTAKDSLGLELIRLVVSLLIEDYPRTDFEDKLRDCFTASGFERYYGIARWYPRFHSNNTEVKRLAAEIVQLHDDILTHADKVDSLLAILWESELPQPSTVRDDG